MIEDEMAAHSRTLSKVVFVWLHNFIDEQFELPTMVHTGWPESSSTILFASR